MTTGGLIIAVMFLLLIIIASVNADSWSESCIEHQAKISPCNSVYTNLNRDCYDGDCFEGLSTFEDCCDHEDGTLCDAELHLTNATIEITYSRRFKMCLAEECQNDDDLALFGSLLESSFLSRGFYPVKMNDLSCDTSLHIVVIAAIAGGGALLISAVIYFYIRRKKRNSRDNNHGLMRVGDTNLQNI